MSIHPIISEEDMGWDIGYNSTEVNSTNDFDVDKEFSDSFIPNFDKHIQSYLGADVAVKNMKWDDPVNRLMDKEYHIDVIAKDIIGAKYSIQTKVLRYEMRKFNTFTMEFYQNRFSKEHGEFFNILAQLYFHGYSNEAGDDFDKLYVVNVVKFKRWIQTQVSDLETITRPAPSNASFLYYNYDLIPKDMCERIK